MLQKYESLLNIKATKASGLFKKVDHPWEVLSKIEGFILEEIKNLDSDYIKYAENVYIHKTVQVSPTAVIVGPSIIGENTEIRPGAYIRGNVLIGKNCVIGNSTEIKNSIIFDNAQCPHYDYVGDSVLGEYAHTGAGVVLSNLKNDHSNISVIIDGTKTPTNLHKFSAILGNHCNIGCNCVLCPGTIIGQNTSVYPLVRVRGTIKENMIVKSMDDIVPMEER